MKNFRFPLIAIAASLSVSFASTAAYAAPGDTVATVTHLSGVLSAKRADGSLKVLSLKSAVLEGDVLQTEKDAFARIKFVDDAEVVMRPNTTLKVAEYTYPPATPQNGKTSVNLLRGGMRAVTGLIGKSNRDAVTYGTPTATIGIRGTTFVALYCQADCGASTPSGNPLPPGLHVNVVEGAINVSNNAGSMDFGAGQFGYVASPQQPPVPAPQQFSVPFAPPSQSGTSASSFSSGEGNGDAIDCEVR